MYRKSWIQILQKIIKEKKKKKTYFLLPERLKGEMVIFLEFYYLNEGKKTIISLLISDIDIIREEWG